MQRLMRYYCDGNILNKDLVARIAKEIFGEEPVSVQPDLSSMNGHELKGLEIVMSYSGTRTDIPARVAVRKRSDGEPPYNPDYSITTDAVPEILPALDERIRILLLGN